MLNMRSITTKERMSAFRSSKRCIPTSVADVLAEWYKQTVAGNGPLHYRQQENPLMPYLTSVLASTAVQPAVRRPFLGISIL